MVLSILTLITFLVIIIILEKNNGKDLFPLFLPLAKGKFSLDEDGNLYSSEFFEKNKWIGVLTQILVYAILLVALSKYENLELAEKIALFFPAYFTFEWIIYLGFIIIKNSFIILSKSKELLILFFSTVFAIIYSIIIYHNEPFWVLFLLLIVIINLLQTINIMYKLCIRENDFFKEEFENITAIKQIFVII